jgi:hypothetical protein
MYRRTNGQVLKERICKSKSCVDSSLDGSRRHFDSPPSVSFHHNHRRAESKLGYGDCRLGMRLLASAAAITQADRRQETAKTEHMMDDKETAGSAVLDYRSANQDLDGIPEIF